MRLEARGVHKSASNSLDGGNHLDIGSTGGANCKVEAGVRHDGVEVQMRERQRLGDFVLMSVAASSGVLQQGIRGPSIETF